MASRQERNEARRAARIEQEESERRAERARKRLQLVLGGVLAAGILVGVVLALFTAGEDAMSRGAGPAQEASAAGVRLPAQRTEDMREAAAAAGCTVRTLPNEGNDHAQRRFTASDYGSNPPTSGAHFPQWAQDGTYEPGATPPLGELVHTLEHGRINVQYRPGTSARLRRQLEAFVAENDGYHMLMYENATGMEPQVAATAWDHLLQCPRPGARMWDALRTFRDRYVDKGPETVP